MKSTKTKLTSSPTKGVYCDRCNHWFPGRPGDRHECLAKLISDRDRNR